MLTEKDYCDYDICVALRELGFTLDMTEKVYERNLMTNRYETIPKPLLYEAQKWLREEKNIIVEVFVDDDSDTPITYNIYKDGECVLHHHGGYWSVKEWETALSEGIMDAVEILKEYEADKVL